MEVAAVITLARQVAVGKRENTDLSKPRVLVVGAFPPPAAKIYGGVVTSCRALIQSSLPDRINLELIDSTQISNPPPSFLKRLLLAAKRVLILSWKLLRKRPDAVLLFTSMGGSLVEKGAMAWLARLMRTPSLIFPRHAALIDQARSSRFSRLWIRWAFGGAQMFLCQGPAWQRFAIDDLGFTLASAPIIPNWTATQNLLAIGEERLQNYALHNPVRLLFLGWLEREKGVFELLQACARLSLNHEFVLSIAGRGHGEKSARDFVHRKGLAERINFCGWVDDKELEVLLRSSDILVLPSWREGLPNAMIEAMAAGLAVVVSAVGNVPDVVVDGKDALLIPPKNIDALTRALSQVIQDEYLRERLAHSGNMLAAQNFSAETAVVKLEQAIFDVLSPRQHKQRAL